MTVEQHEQREERKVRTCPKWGSRLWNVIEYSAVTGLFRLFCSDCKDTEIKDWVYLNPKVA